MGDFTHKISIVAFIIIIGCGARQKTSGILKININATDTCFTFTDKNNNPISVLREFIILKNTVNDSLSIGSAVIPEKFTGKIRCTRVGNSLLDDEMNIENMQAIDSLCIERYNGKVGKGSLIIKYFY